MKKKLLSVFAAAIVLTMTTLPAISASAGSHGGEHHGRTTSTASYRYSVCKIESCIKTGSHKHNGKYYSSHYYGDGHDYHEYCDTTGCTASGYHEHDGTYHFSHTSYDGHH